MRDKSVAQHLVLGPDEPFHEHQVPFAQVLIMERLATYLAVPVPAGRVVIWEQGFDAGRLGRISRLGTAAHVRCWGDLDTHCFAILNLVRPQLQQATSVRLEQERIDWAWVLERL